jgi:tetratricopeptide (TPR) repeat protein
MSFEDDEYWDEEYSDHSAKSNAAAAPERRYARRGPESLIPTRRPEDEFDPGHVDELAARRQRRAGGSAPRKPQAAFDSERPSWLDDPDFVPVDTSVPNLAGSEFADVDFNRPELGADFDAPDLFAQPTARRRADDPYAAFPDDIDEPYDHRIYHTGRPADADDEGWVDDAPARGRRPEQVPSPRAQRPGQDQFRTPPGSDQGRRGRPDQFRGPQPGQQRPGHVAGPPPPSMRPGQAPVRPGQAPGQPGQGAAQAGQAPMRPGQAPGQPGQPGQAAVRPGQAPMRPGQAPGQSGQPAARAGQAPVRPGQAPVQPGQPGQPGRGAAPRPGQVAGSRPEQPAARGTAVPRDTDRFAEPAATGRARVPQPEQPQDPYRRRDQARPDEAYERTSGPGRHTDPRMERPETDARIRRPINSDQRSASRVSGLEDTDPRLTPPAELNPRMRRSIDSDAHVTGLDARTAQPAETDPQTAMPGWDARTTRPAETDPQTAMPGWDARTARPAEADPQTAMPGWDESDAPQTDPRMYRPTARDDGYDDAAAVARADGQHRAAPEAAPGRAQRPADEPRTDSGWRDEATPIDGLPVLGERRDQEPNGETDVPRVIHRATPPVAPRVISKATPPPVPRVVKKAEPTATPRPVGTSTPTPPARVITSPPARPAATTGPHPSVPVVPAAAATPPPVPVRSAPGSAPGPLRPASPAADGGLPVSDAGRDPSSRHPDGVPTPMPDAGRDIPGAPDQHRSPSPGEGAPAHPQPGHRYHQPTSPAHPQGYQGAPSTPDENRPMSPAPVRPAADAGPGAPPAAMPTLPPARDAAAGDQSALLEPAASASEQPTPGGGVPGDAGRDRPTPGSRPSPSPAGGVPTQAMPRHMPTEPSPDRPPSPAPDQRGDAPGGAAAGPGGPVDQSVRPAAEAGFGVPPMPRSRRAPRTAHVTLSEGDGPWSMVPDAAPPAALPSTGLNRPVSPAAGDPRPASDPTAPLRADQSPPATNAPAQGRSWIPERPGQNAGAPAPAGPRPGWIPEQPGRPAGTPAPFTSGGPGPDQGWAPDQPSHSPTAPTTDATPANRAWAPDQPSHTPTAPTTGAWAPDQPDNPAEAAPHQPSHATAPTTGGPAPSQSWAPHRLDHAAPSADPGHREAPRPTAHSPGATPDGPDPERGWAPHTADAVVTPGTDGTTSDRGWAPTQPGHAAGTPATAGPASSNGWDPSTAPDSGRPGDAPGTTASPDGQGTGGDGQRAETLSVPLSRPAEERAGAARDAASADGGPSQRASSLADQEAAAKRSVPAPRPAGDAAIATSTGHPGTAPGPDDGWARTTGGDRTGPATHARDDSAGTALDFNPGPPGTPVGDLAAHAGGQAGGSAWDPAPGADTRAPDGHAPAAAHTWSESEALARRLGFTAGETPSDAEGRDREGPTAGVPVQRVPADGRPGPATDGEADAVRMGAHAAPYMDPDGTLHNLRPIARLAVSGPDDEPRRAADSEFVGQWFAAKLGSDDQPAKPNQADAETPATRRTEPADGTPAAAAGTGFGATSTIPQAGTAPPPAPAPGGDATTQSKAATQATPGTQAQLTPGTHAPRPASAAPATGVTAENNPHAGPRPDAGDHVVIDLDVTDLFGAMVRAEQHPAAGTPEDAWPPADRPADPHDATMPPAALVSAVPGPGGSGRPPTTGTDPEADAVRAEVAQRMAALSQMPAPEPAEPAPAASEPLRGRPEALSAADLEAIRWRLDGGTLREVVDNKDALRELGERLDGPLSDEADNVVKAGLLSVRAEVYRLLGELGMAAAASRLALAHAESARDVQSTVIAQAELAHVLRLRGDFVEADRLFTRAAAAVVPEPLRSVVHENAGRSCFDQGRHMEALDHFARAVRLGRPDDTELAARIGVCLQAVYIHVLRDGWGPYPRNRQDVLGVTAAAEREAGSAQRKAGDAGPNAFDETTAEQPIVHPR